MVPWTTRRLRQLCAELRSGCTIRCPSGLWRKLTKGRRNLYDVGTAVATMEVVYEGWLVKSPPEKRIRRAKWRRRWFVLRPSGQVPQQYILEYYTDQTYKKLKGAIDLDQCEQVDAGLEVDTKSKFVFDIKTTKRTYYLVAETEDVMNKWVDCICRVCELRQQPEEAATALTAVDPASTLETNVSSELPEPLRQPSKAVTETPQPPEPYPLLEPLPDRSSPKDDSNPYIPISECITGKPVSNGAPPTPNSRVSATRGSGLVDFYDVPRCGTGRTSPDPIMDAMCRVPRPPDRPKRDGTGGSVRLDTVPPPTVNWSTYPKDSSNPGANGQVQDYDPVPPLRPTSSGSHSDSTCAMQNSSVYNGDTLGRAGLTIRKAGLAGIAPPRPVKAWNGAEEGYDRVPPARPASVDADIGTTETDSIPPRPPKPANIRVRPSTGGCDVYDVPPPLQQPLRSSQDMYDTLPSQPRPALHDGYSIPPCPQPVLRNDGYDVPNPASSTRMSYDAYDVPRPSTETPSPSAKVVPTLPHPPRNSLDEAYDFPKSAASPEALVPPSGAGQRSRMHQYCNAPVGMFSSRDNIFNYEYRPSLMDAVQRDDGDVSAHQPSSYANVSTSPSTPNLTAVPPAINRGLKPRKASSDNSASLPVFPLAPPPITRNCNQTHTSFTRPRHRSKGDLLAPEEDSWSNASSSRRNSTNEDPITRHTGGISKKKGEIQYLDLDLDSDPGGPAQSPRSPEQKATGSNTVYRTVDFLKTIAFNRTRQNVEESYRSHKDGEPCK